MKLNHDKLNTLAAQLTSENTNPLSHHDRELLAAALLQLAASQDTIARQSRLLQLHGELRSRIHEIANSALISMQVRLDTPNSLSSFDFEGAEAARTQLLASIESANTTRATLAATLAFVRRLIGPSL